MTAVAAALVVAALSPMQTPFDTVFDQIKNLKPTTSVASVKNIILRRDVMELHLDSGQAYLLTPIGGRTIGIAFVGDGSVSFIPPLGIEQFNLHRVLGDSSLNDPISAAVLIFVDSTADELRRQLKFETNERSGAAGVAAGAGVAEAGPRAVFSDKDYPAAAWREGREGTVKFALAIDAYGRVTQCTVTQSSGHADLDATTCRLIVRRARFTPNRDAEGKATSGTFSSEVTWRVPR